jgi:hypothetical protein
VWVPAAWWRALAGSGAALLVVLTALFFGPTKLIPIGVALATLSLALRAPATFAVE